MMIKKSVVERVEAILEEATGQDISSWEKTFLNSIRRYPNLSMKQTAVLEGIEKRLHLSPLVDLDNISSVTVIKDEPEKDKFGFDKIDERPF